MSRRLLSTVINRKLLLRLPSGNELAMGLCPANWLVLAGSRGKIVATVDPEDLFDAMGNRFNDDLPLAGRKESKP